MGDLRFQHNYSYSLDRKGIVVPVSLRSGALKTKVFAKLDIGAEVCLFERSVALDLDLEKGQPIWLETLTGNFLAYGHEITLTTIELSFVLTVYFAANDAITRNLLGRNWLQLVRLGVVDYEGQLYLSAYDEP